MKHKWILAFFLSVMGFAFAGSQDDQPILYYPNDCDIKILPNAGPRIRGDWNFFLTADFIYWTVRQDGMAYAVSGARIDAQGRVHDLDWDWDPGFKLGLGLNLPHDGWDMFLEYTWIHSSASDSTSQAAPTSSLQANYSTGQENPFLTNAKGDWDIHYNNLTLDLGRNAYMSQFMKLRLFAGVHAAWIYQDYNTRFISVPTENERIDRVNTEQDFWGVGLRIGLNNAFQFTKNFSFFADLALSILWGQFDLEREDKITINNISSTTFNTEIKPHTSEPVMNIGAGFRYDGWFSEDRFHFLMQLGWEHIIWVLHNEMITKAGDPGHTGDLYLQGITLKVRLDF